MAFWQSHLGGPLPIIPIEVLKQHQVHEAHDTRFRACARLLQALWRERQQLPIGAHRSRTGRPRKLGSRLSPTAAEAGRNFLSPAIAQLARYELAYQEVGALISRERLLANLLGSQTLAINAMAPLRHDLDLAAKIFRALLPATDIRRVRQIWFEHSPGRGHADHLADKTAFDVAIFYETSQGTLGGLFLEWKYSEGLGEASAGDDNPRYGIVAADSGLYQEPQHAALRVGGLHQLFREHLLAQTMLHREHVAEATFIVIAPRDNHQVQRATSRYASFLAPPGADQVRFANLHLEQFFEALGWAGEPDHAWALFDRYLDWRKIDEAVATALAAKPQSWRIIPPAGAPRALLEKAA